VHVEEQSRMFPPCCSRACLCLACIADLQIHFPWLEHGQPFKVLVLCSVGDVVFKRSFEWQASLSYNVIPDSRATDATGGRVLSVGTEVPFDIEPWLDGRYVNSAGSLVEACFWLLIRVKRGAQPGREAAARVRRVCLFKPSWSPWH
jgi:hypothetical protein